MANQGGSSCSAPIPLRRDFDAPQLRSLAKSGPQARRLLALAAIYDGAARTEQRKSAASGFRSSGTGYCTSTSAALTASCTASRRASRPSSTNPAPGHRPHHREWPDSGSARRGPLAVDRSGAMDLRGIPASRLPSRRSAGSCAPWATAELSARPPHHAQAEGAIENFKKFPHAKAKTQSLTPRFSERQVISICGGLPMFFCDFQKAPLRQLSPCERWDARKRNHLRS